MSKENEFTPQKQEISPSPEFLRIKKLLEEREVLGKETKFGKVDVQFNSDSLRPVTDPGEHHIEIQVFSTTPEKTYTRFKMYGGGHTETFAQKGWGQDGEKIDPSFTLEEILGEI